MSDTSVGAKSANSMSGCAANVALTYVDDHLGSTHIQVSKGGWPVWSGQLTPFGEEIVAGQVLTNTLGNQQPGDGTSMHYKFTGKERDSESGVDTSWTVARRGRTAE